MSILSFEIGATYAGRVNVETLTTVPNMGPASEFYDYSETLPTGDGLQTSRGFPYAVWKWDGFMPTALFNALRGYCPGASATVIIRTLQDDYSTYAYYTAKMIWPELSSYQRNAKGYTSVIIRFNNLVAYSPP